MRLDGIITVDLGRDPLDPLEDTESLEPGPDGSNSNGRDPLDPLEDTERMARSAPMTNLL